MEAGIKNFENGRVRWRVRRSPYGSSGLGHSLGEGEDTVSSGHHRSKGQPQEYSQNQANNWEMGAHL